MPACLGTEQQVSRESYNTGHTSPSFSPILYRTTREMFVHTFRRRHEDARHRFALRSPNDPEGAPRAQPSLRHLLRPRIETLQHGGRSGISLLHRRIFTIVRVSDDPPGDGQQAPDRVIDGDQHCDHCKTARTTRLGHQNRRGHIMHHHDDTFHKMLPPPRLARV